MYLTGKVGDGGGGTGCFRLSSALDAAVEVESEESIFMVIKKSS